MINFTDFWFGCDQDLIGPEDGVTADGGPVVVSDSVNCDCDNGMLFRIQYYIPIMI